MVVVPHAAPIILLALQLPWPTFVAAALVTGFGEMRFNTLWDAIEMSTTLWIAAAVDLAAVAAMLAAPSVWRLRRIDESQLKPSAQALAAG